ncbi:MAG TPA: hypothetical protein VHM30_10085, partial [Gemmatimonadaceae bacterium]|nr:hypothetical protein [Gemmatimonadaceae bacterium]
LAAAGRISGEQGLAAATTIFARVNPAVPPPAAPAPATPAATPGAAPAQQTVNPVDLAWRRFVGARERTWQLDKFAALAKSDDPAQRVLGYAVLAQSVRNPRFTPEFVSNFVRPVLDAAWADPSAVPSLVQAVRIMRLDAQYAAQLKAYDERGGK